MGTWEVSIEIPKGGIKPRLEYGADETEEQALYEGQDESKARAVYAECLLREGLIFAVLSLDGQYVESRGSLT